MLILLSLVHFLVSFGFLLFIPKFLWSEKRGFDDEGYSSDLFAFLGFVDKLKTDVVVAFVGEPQAFEKFGLNQILNLLLIRRHTFYIFDLLCITITIIRRTLLWDNLHFPLEEEYTTPMPLLDKSKFPFRHLPAKTCLTTLSLGNNLSSKIIGEMNKNLKNMHLSINTETKIGSLIFLLLNMTSVSSSSKSIRNHGRGQFMNSKKPSSTSTVLMPWGTATIALILLSSVICKPINKKVIVWKLNHNLNTLMIPSVKHQSLQVSSRVRRIGTDRARTSLHYHQTFGKTQKKEQTEMVKN